MMNVFVTMRPHPGGMQRLKAIPGLVLTHEEAGEDQACEYKPDVLRDQHVLFCEVPPKNLADMRSLKLIQLATAGYSQLFDRGLVEKGIRACNALGLFDAPIAEWNICMMIALTRNVRGMIRNQEHGIWDRSEGFQQELRGTTVGFWGYGGIARETARLARAFGMKVHALARNGVGPRPLTWCVEGVGDPEGKLPDRVYSPEAKREFLRSLDFLVISMPLTKASRGVIGEEDLSSLRPTAYLLNPARGPIIQEDALLKALRLGWIAGAALDTHYYYPMPADHPLWRFPNVIMTPHISGAAANRHYLERAWDIFAGNVERYVDGRPLLNELTAAQLNGE